METIKETTFIIRFNGFPKTGAHECKVIILGERISRRVLLVFAQLAMKLVETFAVNAFQLNEPVAYARQNQHPLYISQFH